MARDHKKYLPVEYIKLAMNLELLRTYPWGLHSFDLLVKSILATRDNLMKPKSYVLNGFTHVFQLWAMESIPIVGKLLSKKEQEDLSEGPRCSNWLKVSKIGYDEFSQLERTFTDYDIVFSYISLRGYNDIVASTDYLWPDETEDVGVDKIMKYISDGKDFRDVVWEAMEEEVEDTDDNIENDTDDECLEEKQEERIPMVRRKSKKRFRDAKRSYIIEYGYGMLSSYGKPMKKWGIDVDRIYVPVHVSGNYWILLCVNFHLRTIHVFDCSNNTRRSADIEPFRVVISHILKAVQSPSDAKLIKTTPYFVLWYPMAPDLNVTLCDCGLYALKYIECHVRGLDLTQINDINIGGARLKIAHQLWEAASDPELIERMSKYVPPKSDGIVEGV